MADSRRVAPYRVTDSGKALDEVLREVNAMVFRAHGPDWRERGGAVGIVADPLFQYEHLLRGLCAIDGLECVPFRELLAEPCPPDRIRCGIRHDVDVDVRAALSQAELEQRHGVRSSWYVLHTAPYYGTFDNGVFHRNECMIHVYRRLQDLGHEVALHTDPLLVYQVHGMDGAEAVREEIAWLRGAGLDVVGTVAHNSASVYGAENYEIFKGRAKRRRRRAAAGGPMEVVKDGRWAPLEVLDEAELGLAYEGNETFSQKHTPLVYGALRGADAWRWNPHLERFHATHPRDERWFYDQDRLLHDIAGLERGCMLVLVVHPVYYGLRHSAEAGPPARMQRTVTVTNRRTGWQTWAPHGLVARCGDAGGVQEFQTIQLADELGMVDLPDDAASDPDAPRVLLLGGTNLDGSSVTVHAHMHVLLRELLGAALGRGVRVCKLAHPGSGIAQAFGWYRAVCDTLRPHLVLLGIGADEAARSLPEWWQPGTGFDPAHPPGECLIATDGEVRRVVRSGGAAIRRRAPRPLPGPASLALGADAWRGPVPRAGAVDRLRRLVEAFAGVVRADGARLALLLDECGESVGLWPGGRAGEEERIAHARVHGWLEEIAAAGDVPLVDPYARFLARTPPLATHWRGVPEWNRSGHRLAACAALDALLDEPRAALAERARTPPPGDGA